MLGSPPRADLKSDPPDPLALLNEAGIPFSKGLTVNGGVHCILR